MYKKAIIFLSIFSSITVFAGTKMQQKKVCNTLENGAEFCTVFNTPVDDKPKKSMDEINADLEKKSELVFKNKNEQKSFVKIDESSKVVTPPLHNTKSKEEIVKKEEKKVDEHKNQPSNKKEVVAEKETKEERIARRKLKKEQAKKAREDKEQHQAKIKKEKSEETVSVSKKESSEIKVDPKSNVADASSKKPTLKDKKSFSEFLNTVKNLD